MEVKGEITMYIAYGMGARLKEMRDKKDLTEEQLAEIIDKSVQTISNLENDRKGTSIETFVKLCNALETSADYLLFGKK